VERLRESRNRWGCSPDGLGVGCLNTEGVGTAAQPQAPGSHTGSVFSRVIVGIDGTEPGFEACRQATRLLAPEGRLELVSAVYLAGAALAGWSSARVAEELEHEAGGWLEEARQIVGEGSETRLVNGAAASVLLREAEREHATLLALGTHGHSRFSEIVLGGVAGEILHKAPCSVLIARPSSEPAAFPRSIVVGLDGSQESDRALAVAEDLGRRLHVPLHILVALRGRTVDLAHVHLRTPFSESVDEHPVEALVEASREADLVVVGSRGLHGMKALGSVSERLAHRACSSVLVVRPGGS
jgi:nucleotide-binding universal stress UspA family protein